MSSVCAHDWFAVTVKPQHEKTVSQTLGQKGFEVLLPCWRSRRKWSDRVKEVELPLFPGYVLCQFDAAHRTPVLQTPGVRSVVGFGGGPAPIEETEISSLTALVKSGRPLEPWPYLEPGREVRLNAGPFCGAAGTIVKQQNGWRLVVSIHLLNRAVAVEIDREMVDVSAASRMAAAARQ